MTHYQVVIIGGGPGGYEAAIRLNQYGIQTAVFEKERIGGVCLNWGCIPTKALVKSAELWQELQEAENYGLNARTGELNYADVYARKNDIVEKLVSGIEHLYRKRKLPIIKATVMSIDFQSGNYIINSDNEEPISAEYLILATGSLPKNLPGIQIDEIDILSSTGILKLEHLPRSLAVIGGGVIGCEFAAIMHTFGVETHIIEFLPTLISTEDEEVAKRLQIALKKSGIKIKTGVGVVSVQKVEQHADAVSGIANPDTKQIANLCYPVEQNADAAVSGLLLTLSDESTLFVEKALLSVGRIPAMQLDWKNSAAPATQKGAILIDKFMQTDLPRVYAIGDVTAKMQLAHTAAKQGLIAAEHISATIKQVPTHIEELIYENIPRCIFTHPEVSSVGLTEKQAQDKYNDIIIGRFPFTANGKALAGGNTYGFVKTIAKADDQTLVGMHIIGPQAAELIAQGSILINLGAKAKDVEKIVFAHPTLSEAIMESLEDLNGLSIHKV